MRLINEVVSNNLFTYKLSNFDENKVTLNNLDLLGKII